MKTFVLAALGTVAGLVLGAAAGILAGIVWINIVPVSDFEGQSAMLVFFTFAPAGSVLGGLRLSHRNVAHPDGRRELISPGG